MWFRYRDDNINDQLSDSMRRLILANAKAMSDAKDWAALRDFEDQMWEQHKIWIEHDWVGHRDPFFPTPIDCDIQEDFYYDEWYANICES